MFEPKLKEQRMGNFKLETNVLKGFHSSVKSGQNRLAFEYAVEVVDSLVEYVEALEARLQTLETEVRAQKPEASKPVAKKAAAAKVSDDAE